MDSSNTGDGSGCGQKYRAHFNELVDEVKKHGQEADMFCKKRCHDVCTVQTVKNKFPFLKWGRKYNLECFQGDLISGIAVGLTVLPQSLAYAFIANLPPQYGLYSSFIGCLLYCVFGTSKDVNMGPTAVISLMTATYTAIDFAGKTDMDEDMLRQTVYPVIATVLAFGSGIVLLVMYLLKIGFLVEFISHPIINSFTTAAALTIFCSQIKKWLVLSDIPREFIPQAIETLKNLNKTKIPDFVLGLVCMIILLILKKLRDITCCNKKPGPVVAKLLWLISMGRNALIIIVASLLAWGLHKNDLKIFKLTGDLPPGLPPFSFPKFNVHAELSNRNITMNHSDIISHLGSGFLLLPLIAYIEIVAIGKAFGRRNGYRPDADQELIALGLANFCSSFFSAYPMTASFSRSAVNMQSGVVTPLGGIVTGVMVILALQFLTGAFYFIPEAALAAVIMMAVINIIDFSMIPKLWKVKKADLLPWFVTFIVGLAHSIEYGIVCGVGVSLCLLLFPWARPGLKVETLDDQILCVKLAHGVRFPATDFITEKVIKHSTKDDMKRHVLFDCCMISTADFSSVHWFEEISMELSSLHLTVAFINLQEDIQQMIKAANIDCVHAFDSKEAAIDFLKTGTSTDVFVVVLDEVSSENESHNISQNDHSTHL